MCCFKRAGTGGLGLGVVVLLFLLFTAYRSLFTVVHAQDNRPFLTDKDQFNYALLLHKQGHYTVAAREFGRVIEYFPSSSLVPRAQFMMGDSYLNASKYDEAILQFEQFTKNFSSHELQQEALLKLEAARTRLKDASLLSTPELPLMKVVPQPNQVKEAPVLAVQVLLFEGRTYEEVDRELERLKSAGVDTVIIRVFHNKGDRLYPFVKKELSRQKEIAGVYFETQHAPVIEDILAPIVRMAHKKGLKVFAWMTTRYADYGLEDRSDLQCKAYDFGTRGLMPCKGLDLFNEEVVTHLQQLFEDLARYDIDGILFQDDLVLRQNEGFGTYSSALFEREFNASLIPEDLYERVTKNEKGGYIVGQYTPAFWKWASWKNKRLLQVANRLQQTVREKNPKVKFAINLMYETVSNPPYALAWLSQSIHEAVKQGFDYYAIMAYQQQMQDELKQGASDIRSLIAKMTGDAAALVGEPSKVLMKLQIIDWNTSQPLPDDDVIGLFHRIKEIDNISLAVVPYRKDFPFELLGQNKLTQVGKK